MLNGPIKYVRIADPVANTAEYGHVEGCEREGFTYHPEGVREDFDATVQWWLQ